MLTFLLESRVWRQAASVSQGPKYPYREYLPRTQGKYSKLETLNQLQLQELYLQGGPPSYTTIRINPITMQFMELVTIFFPTSGPTSISGVQLWVMGVGFRVSGLQGLAGTYEDF